jgi:diacylglycerol kinase (ATP)
MTTAVSTATLLVSPAAGGGTGSALAEDVARRLRSAVGRLTPVTADSAEGSLAAARRAVADGTDVLVVLGGDGLAHLAVQACAGSDTALAVIPAGTGNDLARALGMPHDVAAAADVVAASVHRPRPIDLGRVEGGAWFATVLCAGFDAAVNARANRMRWPRGKHRYDAAILGELAALRPQHLVVQTPGGDFDGTATLVAVGNTGWYGGGIPVCPKADPTDGLLDVTIVGQSSRRDLLRILPRLRHGSHVDHPAVTTLRATSVHVAGDNTWTSYADGDPCRDLPLTVRAASGALRVVTPAPVRPVG